MAEKVLSILNYCINLYNSNNEGTRYLEDGRTVSLNYFVNNYFVKK